MPCRGFPRSSSAWPSSSAGRPILHPATQKRKVEGLLALITTREELEALNQVNYVAVDFELPDGAATMSALLVDKGFDPRVPTCVIWEGASTIACDVRNG